MWQELPIDNHGKIFVINEFKLFANFDITELSAVLSVTITVAGTVIVTYNMREGNKVDILRRSLIRRINRYWQFKRIALTY